MKKSQRDPNWINVKLDWLMIKSGLRRAPKLEIDEDRFKKTTEEKEALSKAKAEAARLTKQVKIVTTQPKYHELLNKKKLVVNLLNTKKIANFKTTYCFYVLNTTEAIDVIKNGMFFPSAEVKSAYYDNKPFKFA